MLSPGFYGVAAGALATVVTHLQIRDPMPKGQPAWPDGLRLDHIHAMDTARYRALFRRVGRDWLWSARLRLSDADLTAHLAQDGIELWVLQRADEDLGICELDLREAPERAEIAYFGMSRALTGQGLGVSLMDHAFARAAAHAVGQLTVHTCTLDHPAALRFYRSCGFVPTRQEVEIMPDPRREGLLPQSAAPQIPLADLAE